MLGLSLSNPSLLLTPFSSRTMPLLKRKRFPLLSPPPYDPHRKESRDRQVWYSPITAEIFTDYTYPFFLAKSLCAFCLFSQSMHLDHHISFFYRTYLQRTQLYKQPIWQCETTGRGNLTYAQALESERLEKERVQDKLPEQLQRRVLQRAQFRKIPRPLRKISPAPSHTHRRFRKQKLDVWIMSWTTFIIIMPNVMQVVKS